MKYFFCLLLSLLSVTFVVWFNTTTKSIISAEGENEMESEQANWEWEYKILADPSTGKIPKHIRQKEVEATRGIPYRTFQSPTMRGAIMNNYVACGPTNFGGRTRILVPDIRYNNTTNKVLISGGVNGGLFRSADGGQNWTFVNPEDDIHTITGIAQDPRPGHQDTWYAGGGEMSPTLNPPLAGYGFLKSTDNGITWKKYFPIVYSNDLSRSVISGSSLYDNSDNPLDYIQKIAVNPKNGDVYVAGAKEILRSIDGATSFDVVLGNEDPNDVYFLFTDICITADGNQIFAALSQIFQRSEEGVWQSSTGDKDLMGRPHANWKKIAGDAASNPAGWAAETGRICLGIAPSNSKLLYVFCSVNNNPDADLFKCNMSNQTYQWEKLTSNIYAPLNVGISYLEPMHTYSGYCMNVTIKPDDANTVFLCGVSLYRSSDGFTSTNTNITANDGIGFSHADYHCVCFDPSNPKHMFVSNDGGIQETDDCTASRITWRSLNNSYQTFQYYNVAIDPTAGADNFAGGTQDNGTSFRDATGTLNFLAQTTSVDEHKSVVGGDGGPCGITKKTADGRQYLIASYQGAECIRVALFNSGSPGISIKPAEINDPRYWTPCLYLDPDNTDYLYYAHNNDLYRTRSSTTVTPGSWEKMPSLVYASYEIITAMATTRGSYSTNTYLFVTTSDGRIIRYKDPAGLALPATPDIILAPGMGLTVKGSTFLDISVNPRNQDTVMAVVSNYGVKKIFWTGNATAQNPTWKVLDGNLSVPAILSCEVALNGNSVEYYVGTSVGLFSTEQINGNSTIWMREGTGAMKYAIIRSLAYRWQDNTMVVGTYGNGMFYTKLNSTATPVDNVSNDSRFIKQVFPVPANRYINYTVGNGLNVKSIIIELYNFKGQLVLKKDSPYKDGNIDLASFAKGVYVLYLKSNDNKYLKITKIAKL